MGAGLAFDPMGCLSDSASLAIRPHVWSAAMVGVCAKTRTDYGEQLCGPDGFADTTTAHRAGRRLRLNSDHALIGSEEPRSDSYILDVDSQQPCA